MEEKLKDFSTFNIGNDLFLVDSRLGDILSSHWGDNKPKRLSELEILTPAAYMMDAIHNENYQLARDIYDKFFEGEDIVVTDLQLDPNDKFYLNYKINGQLVVQFALNRRWYTEENIVELIQEGIHG